jgi:hypothetical protein
VSQKGKLGFADPLAGEDAGQPAIEDCDPALHQGAA